MVGDEARKFAATCDILRVMANRGGYEEVVLPSLVEQEVFVNKAGTDILEKMYTFKDKGDRDICLMPEATALIQREFKEHWDMERSKPIKAFYIARCWRYDNPQKGRYREFTQFGVEILGAHSDEYQNDLIRLTEEIMTEFSVNYMVKESVKRGLTYYVEEGFEVECPALGAQRQIVGGGRYDCGIGFALGIERLLMATNTDRTEE